MSRTRSNRKRKFVSPEKQFESQKKLRTVSELSNMEQTNEYLKQIVENNTKIVQENQAILKQIQLQNDNYEKHFQLLNTNLFSVQARVNYLDTVICSRSVSIVGVPSEEEETPTSLIKVVKKIFGAVKVSFTERDIDDIFRIGRDKKVIKVEFISKLKRRELVAAARNTELTGNVIGLNSGDRISVFEYLSPQNASLHREAKELRKGGAVEFAWVKNGRVFVKEKEGRKAVLVKTVQDLLKFKK